MIIWSGRNGCIMLSQSSKENIMLKTKPEKYLAGALFSLLFFGGLMCCSGIHFPFLDARGGLNQQLQDDFGVALPSSAEVVDSYWVALHDPEHVYKIQMAPADLAVLMQAWQAAATAKRWTVAPPSETSVASGMFGPVYRRPAWWNNPPLRDATLLKFDEDRVGASVSFYHIIYAKSAGVLYVAWGRT